VWYFNISAQNTFEYDQENQAQRELFKILSVPGDLDEVNYARASELLAELGYRYVDPNFVILLDLNEQGIAQTYVSRVIPKSMGGYNGNYH
jgi:hypothetical protein